MSSSSNRDHLEHLPGRVFLTTLAVFPALAAVGGAIQLLSAESTRDAVLWAVVVAVGVIAVLAIVVAWEERSAHVHALVREAIEDPDPAHGADAVAELLRMGAHKQVDYLRERARMAAGPGEGP